MILVFPVNFVLFFQLKRNYTLAIFRAFSYIRIIAVSGEPEASWELHFLSHRKHQERSTEYRIENHSPYQIRFFVFFLVSNIPYSVNSSLQVPAELYKIFLKKFFIIFL